MGEFREGVGPAAMFGDGVNWDATSHQQIHEWFAQAPPEGMRASVEAWTDKIAAHFQAAADKVNGALQASGVHWEGQAAEAMRSGTAPLAEHALVAKEAAALAGEITMRQVMDARDLAVTIPEPPPVRTQQELLDANGGDVLNYLEDVQAQEGAAREAESRAQELAASYDTSTDDAVAELPRFEPVVSVTAGVATPSQPGPDVIEYGGPGSGGASGGGPGPGADGGRPAGPAPVVPPAAAPAAAADTPGGTSGQSWTPPQGGGPSTPTAPVGPPGQDGGRPGGPVPGLVAGPGSRSTSGGPGGRPPGGGGAGGRLGGQGGSAGGQPGARGGGAPGPGAGVRGGPGAVESPAARGGAASGRASGAGMMPMGAAGGRGRGDEDTERSSPEYLRDHHDEFWDDTPPVAPPVIGEDDDE